MSWAKHGKLREDALKHRRTIDALRDQQAKLEAHTGPTERRLKEARVVLARLDRQISGTIHKNERHFGQPPRRQPPRHGERLPHLPRAMVSPAELEATAAQLRAEAEKLISEPAAHDAMLCQAYELEGRAAENRLRIQLGNVDGGTFKRLLPEVKKRRAALSDQVDVLEREAEHEARPLQELQAEIARLVTLADDAEEQAAAMERSLLGLSDEVSSAGELAIA